MMKTRIYLCFLLSAFCFLPRSGLAADATFDSLKPQTTDLASTPALTAKIVQILYDLREALQGIGTNQMRIAGTISASNITNLTIIDVNPTNSAMAPLYVKPDASTNAATQLGAWTVTTTPTQISPVAFSVNVAALSTCYQITNAVAIRLISLQNTNAGAIYLGFATNGTYQVAVPTGTNTAWSTPANEKLYATNLWLGAGASGGTGVVNGVLFY